MSSSIDPADRSGDRASRAWARTRLPAASYWLELDEADLKRYGPEWAGYRARITFHALPPPPEGVPAGWPAEVVGDALEVRQARIWRPGSPLYLTESVNPKTRAIEHAIGGFGPGTPFESLRPFHDAQRLIVAINAGADLAPLARERRRGRPEVTAGIWGPRFRKVEEAEAIKAANPGLPYDHIAEFRLGVKPEALDYWRREYRDRKKRPAGPI